MPLLHQWHTDKDKTAGRLAFGFLEVELRLMTSHLTQKGWPDALVEEALHSLLVRLVNKPLSSDITNLKPYLKITLRNRCIDAYRKAKRRPEEIAFDDIAPDWEPTEYLKEQFRIEAQQKERSEQMREAFEQLNIADRVALKLENAPYWLNDEELSWIGQIHSLKNHEVRQAVLSAKDTYALTYLLDPGNDDPDEPKLRRKRMERFRKRRERAAKKLRALLSEDIP